ncbi:MAG TPA: type 4a pilus biogenesis protein PilO [Firmicutes bacterium]|nr:type 4a pilus biogenesis protein PilO [Bacillota bacterium]
MTGNKNRNMLLVIVLILLVVAGAGLLYWNYFLKPAYIGIGDLREEIDGIEQEIALLEEKLEQKSDIEQRWESLSDRRPYLLAKIPETIDLPSVLGAIEKAVRSSSLKLLSLRAGAFADSEQYRSIPFSLQLSGNRKALLTFLRKLEQFPHMTLIDQASIDQSDEGYRLNISFNLIFIPEGQVEEVGAEEEQDQG